MEKKICIACFDGHDTIVRSASFEPGSSGKAFFRVDYIFYFRSICNMWA